MSAASQARRHRPGLEIVAFERGPHTSYSACGIPYYVGRVVDDVDALIARTPQAFRDKQGIDARVLHEVVEIDRPRGRVRVRQLETGHLQWELVSRRPFHVALGTVANKQGRVAGINIGGGLAAFPGVVGTAVSKICAVEVARTGLQEEEIQRLGWEYVSATIKSSTRAGYYPDAGPITVTVLAERGSGRFLGGQIVGIEGAAKRIDVLATALHAGFTVQEMIHLDLGYAPPYSPVWDPVLIAARKAVDLL
jgi:NADPH-dependent 2,4-dienoyl-CoA reductase/sulfur reductase-like enzyme